MALPPDESARAAAVHGLELVDPEAAYALAAFGWAPAVFARQNLSRMIAKVARAGGAGP